MPNYVIRTGYIHSVNIGGDTNKRHLLIQLYVPSEDKFEYLFSSLAEMESGGYILAALLRDALALSFPVSCKVAPWGDDLWIEGLPTHGLIDIEIKTPRRYHQADWNVASGRYLTDDENSTGEVGGDLVDIIAWAPGLLKGTDNDLVDVITITVRDSQGKMVELYLNLQRSNREAGFAILKILSEAFVSKHSIIAGYYLKSLDPVDNVPVKWIHYVGIQRDIELPMRPIHPR